ncbi:acetaldehyde dehydrogenase (acetylating) [Mycolicibacterium agri]|nr:acetaldehyde dehydrogenase (acetylating) [Mycolicibacterium agri]
MVKLRRHSTLEPVAMVGIDPSSDGLSRARGYGLWTAAGGIDALLMSEAFRDVDIVFDATSADAHMYNWARLQRTGRRVIDLTPAAVGPFVVPTVNLEEHCAATNVNMVTCGGQATVPVVAALSRVTTVHYAEIVASISSRSAGPGTRANIDEFTVTTARALRAVGGAQRAKAIIVLNPADPPVIMRDTVTALIERTDDAAIAGAVVDMVEAVAKYVPGYRLKQDVQMVDVPPGDTRRSLAGDIEGPMCHVTVFLEVEGAADYLPPYAGNLDIMTAAAVRVGELIAADRAEPQRVSL